MPVTQSHFKVGGPCPTDCTFNVDGLMMELFAVRITLNQEFPNLFVSRTHLTYKYKL